MKKHFLFIMTLAMCAALTAFTTHRGGDVVRIYLNGQQVHQEFVHASQATETFSLSSLRADDRIAVFYSHCGKTGSGRTLAFRNEKSEIVKTLRYPDVSGNTSTMSFSRKDLPAGALTLQLFYSSRELPKGYRLATIGTGSHKTVAKTASL